MDNTNLPSVNSLESLSQNESFVTTKELANVLGISESSLKRSVQKLSSVLGEVAKNNQGGYLFNQDQATLIKQEIQKHHNLSSRQIDNVSTELEENETIAKALSILKTRNDVLQNKIKEMQPKADVYDQLVDRSKLINFRDFAAKIGFTQNEFMTILKAKYIYKNSIGEYRAYSEYQDLFSLRTFPKGVDKTGEQLMLNMNGIKYFTEKYKSGAVAESFINKCESEYQKIMNNTAEKFIEKNTDLFSIDEVAKLSDESPETIKNFCLFQKYIDADGLPTMYGYEILKYINQSLIHGELFFTLAGKDHIVAVYNSIKMAEKGLKSGSIGLAE